MITIKNDKVNALAKWMAEYLGRPPEPDEILDFINGDEQERMRVLGLI